MDIKNPRIAVDGRESKEMLEASDVFINRDWKREEAGEAGLFMSLFFPCWSKDDSRLAMHGPF